MPVLGLADEIGRDNGRVGASICDNCDLRWPGEDINADGAEQHALCLGDEFVAGTDEDIGRLAGKQAEGHRRNSLHAAEGHDDVGAGDLASRRAR